MKIFKWILVNHLGQPLGLDDSSGGSEFVAGDITLYQWWHSPDAAEHYRNIVDFKGTKGYKVVMVTIEYPTT